MSGRPMSAKSLHRRMLRLIADMARSAIWAGVPIAVVARDVASHAQPESIVRQVLILIAEHYESGTDYDWQAPDE